ncbi:hypothetical protein H8K38_13300 [Undibacterium sp. FT79W]|nr:hypothetical protein [Undibacterium sp. FT79W]
MNKLRRFGAVIAVGLMAAGSASAAGTGIDTSAVTSALTDAGAAVAVVGAATLVVVVGTKVFKWVARAL